MPDRKSLGCPIVGTFVGSRATGPIDTKFSVQDFGFTVRGLGFRVWGSWFLLKGFTLRYHNKETIFFTIDPYYGSLNLNP